MTDRKSLGRRFARSLGPGILIGAASFALVMTGILVFHEDERMRSCDHHPITNVNVHGVRFSAISHRISYEPSDDPGTCPDIRTYRFTYRRHEEGLASTLSVKWIENDMALAAISKRSGLPLPHPDGITRVTEDRRSAFSPTTHRGLFLRSGHSGLYRCNVFDATRGCRVHFTIPADTGWVIASMWQQSENDGLQPEITAAVAIDRSIRILRSISSKH